MSSSTDGVSWSPVVNLNTKFSKVVWFKDKFVAVGATGTVATSSEGQAWTLRVTDPAYDLVDLHVSGDSLLVIGTPTSITPPRRAAAFTSIDGLAWMEKAFDFDTRDITPGNGVFVTSAGGIKFSVNGYDWQSATINGLDTSAVTYIVHRFAFAQGKFVAIVHYKTELAGDTGYSLLSSLDGKSWKVNFTERYPPSNSRLNSIAYAGNQFVAVGSFGLILTSLDGINWVKRSSGTQEHLYTVAYAHGLLLVGGTNGTILTSKDGISWTVQSLGMLNAIFEFRFTASAFYALLSKETLNPPYYWTGGANPQRTSENLRSLDGATWSPGPAEVGYRFNENFP